MGNSSDSANLPISMYLNYKEFCLICLKFHKNLYLFFLELEKDRLFTVKDK